VIAAVPVPADRPRAGGSADNAAMDAARRRRAVRDLRAERANVLGRRRRRRAALQQLAGLGRTLRRLRRLAGMSQKDLAAAASVTRAMISAFENEKTFPSLHTLDRLLAALGVSVAELGRALRADDDPWDFADR